MQANWDKLAKNPGLYEELGQVLLQRLYPRRAIAIDGRGGDGGRDTWIPDEGAIVEFKSFTRLGDSQKRQIERSLERAAQHEGVLRWIVIVPVERNQTALDWFARLQAKYPFTLEWLGLHWLSEQMATHADVARYVLLDDVHEAHARLKVLREEQADLVGSVPDLLARGAALDALGNTLSHVWNVRRVPTSHGVVVEVSAKPGARPEDIATSIELRVPPEDPEAMRLQEAVNKALNYGGPVAVPAQYLARIDNRHLEALKLPWGRTDVIIPGVSVYDGLPLTARLRVLPEAGKPRPQALHLTFDHRVVGKQGTTLLGRDGTGLLRVEVLVDHPSEDNDFVPTLSLSLAYGYRKPVHGDLPVEPEALLRTVRALASMSSVHQLELRVGTLAITTESRGESDTRHFTGLAELLDDLMFVRDALDLPLPVPGHWSGSDQVALRKAAQLLRGEQVPLPIASLSQNASPEEARHLVDLLTPHGALIDSTLINYSVAFGDHHLSLAPVHLRMPRVSLVNLDVVLAALDRGDEEIPIELLAWPGTTPLGCTVPFPDPTEPTT